MITEQKFKCNVCGSIVEHNESCVCGNMWGVYYSDFTAILSDEDKEELRKMNVEIAAKEKATIEQAVWMNEQEEIYKSQKIVCPKCGAKKERRMFRYKIFEGDLCDDCF